MSYHQELKAQHHDRLILSSLGHKVTVHIVCSKEHSLAAAPRPEDRPGPFGHRDAAARRNTGARETATRTVPREQEAGSECKAGASCCRITQADTEIGACAQTHACVRPAVCIGDAPATCFHASRHLSPLPWPVAQTNQQPRAPRSLPEGRDGTAGARAVSVAPAAP